MSDKKVERPSRNSSAEHVQPPLAKHPASSGEEAAFDAPRRVDDKGKAALLERFRERDQRFRGEPTSQDPETASHDSVPAESAEPEIDDDAEGGAT